MDIGIARSPIESKKEHDRRISDLSESDSLESGLPPIEIGNFDRCEVSLIS
jgi:hypothetical protein